MLSDPEGFRSTRELGRPEAREELRRLLSDAKDHPRDHLAWADICDEAGEPGLALREYQLALRERPEDVRALERLAILYRERGAARHALAAAERWTQLDPQNPSAVRELVSLYLENDMAEQAATAVEQARRRGLSGELLEILEHAIRAARGSASGEEGEVAGSSLAPSEADVVRFVHLFSGRENVYARQWCNPSGEHGYAPVHQPFTFAAAKNHLLGNMTAGAYCVRLDNTVTFMVFDIDINKSALLRARGSQTEARRLREEVSAQAQRFQAALEALGIAPLLEDSGYKGRHLWLFLEEPVEAVIARQFGTLFLAANPMTTRDLHAEFFPKQSAAGAGIGNLIKLPLGIHRRTGRRSRFLLADGSAAPRPFECLQSLRKLSRDRLVQILLQLKQAPSPAPAVAAAAESDTPQALPPPPTPRPAWTSADFETNPEISHLLRECPVAAALKERVEKHRRLSHDEQVVLAHSLGRSAAGVLAVNYLFDASIDVPAEARLQAPLSGNPISCPKIRKRIPHITSRVNCNCSFDFAPDRYPTPQLHLLTLSRQPAPAPAPAAAEAWNPAESVRALGLLWARRREMEKEIGELEQRLMSHLERSGAGEIELEEGRLVLKQEEGAPRCLVWEAKGRSGESGAQG